MSNGGTHGLIVTQTECAILLSYAARYALLVRTLACVPGQFVHRFATPLCANFPCEPGRLACYQKLWFPGLGFQWGFHGIAALSVATAPPRPP